MGYVKVKEELCTGCRYCELICVYTKEVFCETSRSRIQVYKEEFKGIEKPFVCIQCKKPKCIEACPTGALYKDKKTGIIEYVEEKCTRCRDSEGQKPCVEACPYDAIWYHEEDDIILKCDFCHGDPQCVKYCPTNALISKETKVEKDSKVPQRR